MSVSKVDDETRAHLLVSRVEAAVQRYRSGYEETDKERYSRDLVGWRPEFGFSPALCKFLSEQDQYGRDDPAEFKDAPFFCEAVLYALFGKEDARTLLAYLRHGVGFTHEEFQAAQGDE